MTHGGTDAVSYLAAVAFPLKKQDDPLWDELFLPQVNLHRSGDPSSAAQTIEPRAIRAAIPTLGRLNRSGGAKLGLPNTALPADRAPTIAEDTPHRCLEASEADGAVELLGKDHR